MEYIVFTAGLFFILYIISAYANDKGKDADGNKLEYDERQVAARGVAYKYGFSTIAASNIVLSIVYGIIPETVGDYVYLMLGGSFALGMCVMVGIAIWKDAYEYRNTKNPLSTVLSALLIGAMNLSIVIMELEFADSFAAILKTPKANNLVIAIFCFFLVILYVVKAIVNKREEE